MTVWVTTDDSRILLHLNTTSRFIACGYSFVAGRRLGGAAYSVRVTLSALTATFMPPREPAAPGAPHADPDHFESETIHILKRLSRRPIAPLPSSELLADLGFDSLQVLELVGELEDHFNIAIPLNSLTHIKTVSQIAAEVRRLATEGNAGAQ